MHCTSRAVIVHPRYAAAPPAAPPPPPPAADWNALPLEVVHAIAGHLEKAEDLLSLAAVCSHTRWVGEAKHVWVAGVEGSTGAPPRFPPTRAPASFPTCYKLWEQVAI